MQHKFVRADDSVISAVKSVRYTQQAIDNKCIRFGTAFASCIEVTAYGTGNDVVQNGEVIRYYKVHDVNSSFTPVQTPNEEFVGTFTAISSIPSKNTFSFVAYDDVYKLDVDFSQRLASIKSSFPMTISDLLLEVKDVSGITFAQYGQDSWWNSYGVQVEYFYADGITCRDILSALYELSGWNVKAYQNNQIGHSGYFHSFGRSPWSIGSGNYIICPTDQETYYSDPNLSYTRLYNAFYKENGLSFSDYEANSVSKIIFKKTDGTVIKEKIPTTTVSPDNEYVVSGNIFLDHIIIDSNSNDGLEWAIDLLLSSINSITNGADNGYYGRVRNAEAHLFPFRNPYMVGSLTHAIDANGTKFMFPIMKIVETDSEVVLYSFASEFFDNSAQNFNSTDQNVVALSAIVNKLTDGLDGKVSKDGDTITGNLEVTGSLTNNGDAVLTYADVKYKIYYAVTDLGLTSGSATISGAYSAMPTNSILICEAGGFASSERPSASGMVVIVKRRAARGFILFYGVQDTDKDYRMYLNSSDVPTGTWVSIQLNDFANNAAVDLSSYTSSSNLYTIPADGYVYISNNSGQTGRGMIYGSVGTSTYIQIGNAQGRYSTFVRRGMRTYLDGTSAFYRFVPLS